MKISNKYTFVLLAFLYFCYSLIISSCTKDQPPVVTTSAVSEIKGTTAICGGSVSDEGSSPVTVRGVCWNTAENPSVNNCKTNDGKGVGSFSSNLTELSQGTKYYARAYAKNDEGTGYGQVVTFTTTSYPMIRLKTGTGLNSGAVLNFIALSKDDNYFDLTREEKFAFNKTTADWYIDGGVIPFTTDYKELNDTPGKYYLLLRASGMVMITTINVADGKQTFLISGSYFGGVDIDVEQPKGQLLFEKNPAADTLYLIRDTMILEINPIK